MGPAAQAAPKPSDHGLLDFVQVLHSVRGIAEDVGAVAVGTEGPDLAHQLHVHAVGGGHVARALLELLLGRHLLVLDLLGQAVGHGLHVHVQTVVLVGGLRQTGLRRGLVHRLAELDHGRRDLDGRALHEVVLQILQANLQVQLTGTRR